MERERDADLVTRARAGDRTAFAALAGRHRGTARAVAYRVLRDSWLADDASQEAVVVALVGLDGLADPGRFGAWLNGIALNVARRWCRELSRERAAGHVLEHEPADPAPGPDERAEAAEVTRRVREAIAALAPGQRAAVVGHYLEGGSYREVAAALGISVGAVRNRLHHARSALAGRLGADVPTPARGRVRGGRMDETATADTAGWSDATVAEIRGDGPHVVVLRETGGERRLPIWVGPAEAASLAAALGDVPAVRPMTYQFTAALVAAAGARAEEVRVSALDGTIFYATVHVCGPEGPAEVDARPSDALNLATVLGLPVRVRTDLLDDPAANPVGRPPWRELPVTTDVLAGVERERRSSVQP